MKINSKKIVDERKRVGLSHSGLARKLHMTRQGLWDLLKRGTAPLPKIDMIAKILNYDSKDLLI